MPQRRRSLCRVPSEMGSRSARKSRWMHIGFKYWKLFHLDLKLSVTCPSPLFPSYFSFSLPFCFSFIVLFYLRNNSGHQNPQNSRSARHASDREAGKFGQETGKTWDARQHCADQGSEMWVFFFFLDVLPKYTFRVFSHQTQDSAFFFFFVASCQTATISLKQLFGYNRWVSAPPPAE